MLAVVLSTVKDFRGHDAGNCVFFSFWRCAKRLYCEAVSSRTTEWRQHDWQVDIGRSASELDLQWASGSMPGDWLTASRRWERGKVNGQMAIGHAQGQLYIVVNKENCIYIIQLWRSCFTRNYTVHNSQSDPTLQSRQPLGRDILRHILR